MDNRVAVMNFAQLKEIMKKLECNEAITEETKIFINTGWDSIQELEPEAIYVETIEEFKVEDELTKDQYYGYALPEKAVKMDTSGKKETAIIINNLY